MPGSTLEVLLCTLSFSLFFQVGFHVAEASLEHLILLPSPIKYWYTGVYHHA